MAGSNSTQSLPAGSNGTLPIYSTDSNLSVEIQMWPLASAITIKFGNAATDITPPSLSVNGSIISKVLPPLSSPKGCVDN